MKQVLLLLFLTLTLFASEQESFYYERSKKIILVPVQSVQRSLSNVSYYKHANGNIVGVSDTLLVKFQHFDESILEKYSLSIKKQYSPLLYLLQNKNTSSTLDISNQLFNEKNIEYAHPDFIKKVSFR